MQHGAFVLIAHPAPVLLRQQDEETFEHHHPPIDHPTATPIAPTYETNRVGEPRGWVWVVL
jgi:hypothetical protein